MLAGIFCACWLLCLLGLLSLLRLLILLRVLSLLGLLRRRLGLLLGLGQLILHCLQLSLHRIDLLLNWASSAKAGAETRKDVPSTVPASNNPSLRLTSISRPLSCKNRLSIPLPIYFSRMTMG